MGREVTSKSAGRIPTASPNKSGTAPVLEETAAASDADGSGVQMQELKKEI